MGRKLKRGQAGNVVKYLTRTQAVKKLQLRLAEFRRLCILKGIHPREPKKKFKGQNKTYYHVKDISFLAHEPLLESFRAISAYEKKVKKARAKRNYDLARQLARRAPGYQLDHLIRERYPTFVDALRDIDDALCMVHLFATLPGDDNQDIPVKVVDLSRRLVLEWQAYCCRTHAVRKAFISVKGLYFQFVFYRLYHGLSLKYPPVVNDEAEKVSAELAAIMMQLGGTQEAEIAKREAAAISEKEMKARLASLPADLALAAPAEAAQTNSAFVIETYGADDDEDSEADDDDANDELVIDSGEDEADADLAGDSGSDAEDDPTNEDVEKALRMRPAAADSDGEDEAAPADAGAAAAGGALTAASLDDADVCAALFNGLVVWLAREVPREPLMLLVRACGGIACWEGPGSPYEEGDEQITHQVVDRPVQGHVHLGREYVQPQWVFDSVNFRILVPTGEYAPGKKPPPHLSPFLDYKEEGYTPEYAESLLKLQDAANAARRRAHGVELTGGEEAFAAGEEAEEGPAALVGDAAEQLFHEELAKEIGTVPEETRGTKRRAEEVDEELSDSQKKALMTRKQRKMYEGLRKKEAEKAERVAELQSKRRSARIAQQ